MAPTADRTDPRRLLAPLMVAGGALVVAVLPLVRFTGSLLTGADAGGVLLLAAVAVVVPAALLSAVPPMVVKLQLASLAETGAVVGRLSGIGTLGGIAATFVTGFLLIAILPSSVILVGTGGLTVLAGIAVGVLLRRRTGGGAGRVPVGLLVLAVAGAGLAAVAPTPCEEETAYHCARVVADPERESGRVLMLDTLRHSYVDLDDPTHLEFEYVRAIAAVTDAIAPAGRAAVGAARRRRRAHRCRATWPRSGPGTESLVLEVDPGVVAIDREQLGLETSDAPAGPGRRRPGRPGRGAARGARPGRGRRLRRALGAVAADHPGGAGAGRRGRWPTTASTPSTSSTTRRWASCAPSWPRCARCSRTWCCWPGRRCWPGRTAATWSPSPPGSRCRSSGSPTP